jgi:aspartate ammonia-lyase
MAHRAEPDVARASCHDAPPDAPSSNDASRHLASHNDATPHVASRNDATTNVAPASSRPSRRLPAGLRLDHDLLGSRELSANTLYGIHTLRALENFPSTGARVNPALIFAIAEVKEACAKTNRDLGLLANDTADAIVAAARAIADGQHADQFPLDALQGGAGTSTNMNVNEVIASIAGVTWQDVNLHQSTNDVYPTALRIAAIRKFRELAKAIAMLQGALQEKEHEFASVEKIGRTELQNAVPMTLGAEFSGWAEALGRDRWRTFKCEERLRVVNLGGTAIGTSWQAPEAYVFAVVEQLRDVTGLAIARSDNLVGDTANADALVEVSGILKAHATTLLKLSSDLRLLNFLEEIDLPPLQAGSSIMPWKINPVLLEMGSQIAMKVMANDFLIADAASRAHFQIHEFLPLIAHALLESLELLTRIDERLAPHIADITIGQRLSS